MGLQVILLELPAAKMTFSKALATCYYWTRGM